MQSKKVITLVGMPGAGKKFVRRLHDGQKAYRRCISAALALEEMKQRGLDVTPDNEKFVREDLRKQEGVDVYAKRIVPQIKALFEQNHQYVVADGLYSWSEYKVFKEEFGDNALIIAIAAARKLRHERLANRLVRPLTEVEVTKREYAEIENIEKGGPIANADYTLINNGTPADLLAALDGVLAQEDIEL